MGMSVFDNYDNDYLVFRPPSIQVDKNAFVTARRCALLPEIDKLIYNGLDTVVKWNDGTVTVVHCLDEDEFNSEIGLAMAVSRRYFEECGKPDKSDTPRANFKNLIKNATYYKAKE